MTAQNTGGPPPRAARDEVAAALQTSRELGPEYDDAVAASLAEKLDSAIEARVREHVAAAQAPAARLTPQEQWKSPRLIMGIITMGVSIPLTAISAGMMGSGGVVLAWMGLLALYLISVIGLNRR
ncbi:hypothetical protein O4J56_11695 [Nocardiopsis sp. RSe5-2]|uniref:DUF1707 domain-containing protein n=1 Tax=Nocardiopsis endophytica TaxID=3018445 RepID=A0ABT4U3M0_9ACTN|nr:hypothetical protein [Nocardiopsis endophytica]MDA2811296.1 hypothetical protein [Nocardiopsis endophytica]